MNTYEIFTRTAQDIHKRHYNCKLSKDQEIAEKRINEYFEGKLNLSWKTILREINKLDELSRNKYFEELVAQQINTFGFQYEKNLAIAEDSYKKIVKNWKKLTAIFLSGFLAQTIILILTH